MQKRVEWVIEVMDNQRSMGNFSMFKRERDIYCGRHRVEDGVDASGVGSASEAADNQSF